MARYYEIPVAFKNSITVEPDGRRIVRTEDFVRELAGLNHHPLLKEAKRGSITTRVALKTLKWKIAHARFSS